MANGSRDKTLITFRCKPDSTMTGVTLEQDQQKPFHVEVASVIEPLWARVGPQSPAGQAVIIIGTTTAKIEVDIWMWMRMKPTGKGPEAIILCGMTQKNIVPEGRIVLGGLMVGRWTPEGSGAPPAPAGPPVAHTPIPTASATLPPGALPVIMAVVAIEGK
ncbi:MAG: hypothetical protein IMZ44_10155 [Planctomycetes bacterium]|nr:hypothetical protein [Planctomycetota bacterium]